jgi:hypothetical protein
MDANPERLSFTQAVALVARVAEQAAAVANGLQALREPEAASLVMRLARDADRACAALRRLSETTPRNTDWYEVHRDMWVRYGDLGDLAAMTDQIKEAV